MPKPYEEKKFTIPELEELSKDSVDQHLGLYAGYVKNFNAATTLRNELGKDPKNAYAVAELNRRLPFEFDGMRLHEYYFSQWEGGKKELDPSGALGTALTENFGSIEQWEKWFRSLASMRGAGWAILYYDPEGTQFHNVWVEEHHLGHYATLPVILALDVWEHAFVIDYGTTGRGKYIDACFKNYNWDIMEKRFEKVK